MQQGTEMDLLPSSPTVPAGGSKHRRLGSYALPRTTEIPGSKRWELTHRIKTDSSHTIRWKTKERDQYDLKQPFPRKSLTSDHTPCLRTSQCCWGHRSLVAHSDIPFLRFTSKEQLRTRPRCVCSPSTFSPQPPFPAICHLPAMMNIWALKYVSGLRMGHVPSILGTFFLPTPTDPSHCLSLTQGRLRLETDRPVNVILESYSPGSCYSVAAWWPRWHISTSQATGLQVSEKTKLNSHVSHLTRNSFCFKQY